MTRGSPRLPPHEREIRSARFPHGLPDRCDTTVWEAFTDGWLLLVREADSYRIVGIAEDYEAARAWLTEPEVPEPGAETP